jgi:cytidine deaminase
MKMLQPELPVRWPELQQIARTVRNSAWSPYSRFQVGAALLTASGDIVAGCNVENASYGLTICAERTAACTAIAAGHQNFVAICVSLPGISVPCGACRQFLMEFNSQLLVLLDSTDHPPGTPPECVTLESLLPRAFRFQH